MAESLILAVNIFFKILSTILMIRILLSWFPVRSGPIFDLVNTLTEPIMSPIRKMVFESPLGKGSNLDFSPIIVFFLLDIVQNLMISVLLLI